MPIFLAFFYSYGYAFLLINIYSLGHPDWQWAKFLAYNRTGTIALLIIWSGLFSLITALLMKSRKNIAWATKFMNAVAVTIVVFLGVNLVLRFARENRTVTAYVKTWDKNLGEKLTNTQFKDTYKPLPCPFAEIKTTLSNYGSKVGRWILISCFLRLQVGEIVYE